MVQHDGDLGQKMYAAFENVFSRGHTKVLIIGSDCPGLTSADLQLAFEKLSNCDVVIGPANDGGYYLLGLRSLEEAFFINKQWSTESVCAATLEDIQRLGLSCWSLPELVDIDTEADWNLAKASTNR
jgi:rSAM/selenodomain-associated transferase 1